MKTCDTKSKEKKLFQAIDKKPYYNYFTEFKFALNLVLTFDFLVLSLNKEGYGLR